MITTLIILIIIFVIMILLLIAIVLYVVINVDKRLRVLEDKILLNHSGKHDY